MQLENPALPETIFLCIKFNLLNSELLIQRGSTKLPNTYLRQICQVVLEL